MTDPLGQAETYTYDINGNLLTKLDRNNAATAYTYDQTGRLTRVAVTKAGAQAPNDLLSYTYARSGQKLSESNGAVTTSFQYDALGRMTRETTGNAVKDYAYNIGDLRTSFTLKVDGVQQLSNTYSYDALGRMAAVSGSGVSAQYGYDENGNRSAVAYGNGVLETYAYNKANLVTQVASKKGTAILSQYDYAYDLSGNQVTKTDHTGKVNAYTYDGLGQLTGETETMSGTQVQAYSYRYDGFHNRTRLTATGVKAFTTDYIYDKNNRLKQETKLEGGTTHLAEHQYDSNGNLYSTVNSLLATGTGSPSITLSETLDGLTLYEYDGFNRQVGVKTAGTTASYRYLPNGLRQSKTVNGTTTSFVWDGAQTVLTTMGGVSTKYLRGMNLIASLGNETSYYLYNAHGDVVQLTNSSGVVTKEYDYDAFGNEYGQVNGDENPFRYCGEYLDGETNTYYLRARYYNPATGRFWMEDPARDGLNWYTYCGNNPIAFTDPSGLLREAGYYNNNWEKVSSAHQGRWYDNPDAAEFGVDSIVYYSLVNLQGTTDNLIKLKEFGYDVTSDMRNITELEDLVRDIARTHTIKTPPDYINGNLNNTEKVLYNQYSAEITVILFDGIAARERTKGYYGNGYLTNDNADAYRHTYWNALATYHVGAKITRLHTNAHEYGYAENFANKEFYMATIMDIYNNSIGRQIGGGFTWSLKESVLDFVNSGNLLRIRNGQLSQTDSCRGACNH